MYIEAITTLRPDTHVALDQLIPDAEKRHRELLGFKRLFGHASVACFDDNVSVSQRLNELFDKLVVDNSETVDAVIYAHAIPVSSAENIDAISQKRLRHKALSKNAQRYEVDQFHCASGIWGLRLAEALFSAGLADRIVLLVGDQLNHYPADIRYVPGVTALGDGFVGLLLAKKGTGPRVGKIAIDQQCDFPHGALADRTELNAFFKRHNQSVSTLLDAVDHCPDAPLLAHNINFPAWRGAWHQSSPKPKAVDLSLVGDTGHCFAADPFLLLERHLAAAAAHQDPELKELTLLSVGLGSFFGACRIHLHAYRKVH